MTTKHSIQRAHERLGLNEKRAQRVIELAFTRGKRMEDFRGSDYRYLQTLCEEGVEPVVYNDTIYIFSRDGVCVTLYQSPRWFGSRRNYDGKERIRNVRRFFREQETVAYSLN